MNPDTVIQSATISSGGGTPHKLPVRSGTTVGSFMALFDEPNWVGTDWRGHACWFDIGNGREARIFITTATEQEIQVKDGADRAVTAACALYMMSGGQAETASALDKVAEAVARSRKEA
jgi:hypothetical protein